jgi:hypothetical protein
MHPSSHVGFHEDASRIPGGAVSESESFNAKKRPRHLQEQSGPERQGAEAFHEYVSGGFSGLSRIEVQPGTIEQWFDRKNGFQIESLKELPDRSGFVNRASPGSRREVRRRRRPESACRRPHSAVDDLSRILGPRCCIQFESESLIPHTLR